MGGGDCGILPTWLLSRTRKLQSLQPTKSQFEDLKNVRSQKERKICMDSVKDGGGTLRQSSKVVGSADARAPGPAGFGPSSATPLGCDLGDFANACASISFPVNMG